MQRIDNSGAVASLPTPLPTGTPGYFSRGNPSTGLLATPLSADWANMLQEEVMAVLAEAGITPDKEIYTQLRDALRVLYRGQRSGSQVLITGSTALTAGTHGGGIVIGNSSSAITATMMTAVDMLAGRRVAFFNVNTGAMTVQRAGADTFKVNNTTVTSLVLRAGDSLVLESDGAGVWYAVDGSVQLRYAASVATANTPEALVCRDASGNFSAGTITAALNGNASTSSLTTGNAATATALQTARAISLTGDVTGSASFNGAANVSIAATVADSSHNHDAATIAQAFNTGGLQSLAGNGYQKLPGGLILQWGTTTVASSSTSAAQSYPIAFPTAVLCAFGSKIYAQVGAGDGNAAGLIPVGLSTYQVFADDGGGQVSWVAIGY